MFQIIEHEPLNILQSSREYSKALPYSHPPPPNTNDGISNLSSNRFALLAAYYTDPIPPSSTFFPDIVDIVGTRQWTVEYLIIEFTS